MNTNATLEIEYKKSSVAIDPEGVNWLQIVENLKALANTALTYTVKVSTEYIGRGDMNDPDEIIDSTLYYGIGAVLETISDFEHLGMPEDLVERVRSFYPLQTTREDIIKLLPQKIKQLRSDAIRRRAHRAQAEKETLNNAVR
jgi:hypothetical protein